LGVMRSPTLMELQQLLTMLARKTISKSNISATFLNKIQTEIEIITDLKSLVTQESKKISKKTILIIIIGVEKIKAPLTLIQSQFKNFLQDNLKIFKRT